MAHRGGGEYSLTARLAGVNDKAGLVVSVGRQPGQTFKAMGEATAELLREGIRAYEDAKDCVDQMVDKPDKAAASAEKAVRRVPNHGLANFCLAQIAIGKQENPSVIIPLLDKAVAGDPQSLPAWTDLATQYEALGDSAKVIEAFQQMLLIAPTNQQLRETAIRLFNQYGQPDAAVDIAKNGLELDPTNADLWDLLSNAYAVSGNFGGAIDALEQVYQNDSTKADSLYFLKVMVFADEQPDTARLLKWARIGVDKYPTNVNLLGFLAKGYGLVGELDSALAVTSRLLEIDPTNIPTTLSVMKVFADGRRAPDAMPLIDIVLGSEDEQAKQSAAVILTNGALPLLQEPQDLEGAAAITRKAIALTGTSNAQLATTANYVLGIATFLQVPKLDPQAEQEKSCDIARQMDALMKESEVALGLGRDTNPQQAGVYEGYLRQYKPRVASMITAYCR
jgi:tetratricopeptide (TPR) repeat protein